MFHEATCCQVHKQYDTSYSQEYEKKYKKANPTHFL